MSISETLKEIQDLLRCAIDTTPEAVSRYFKTGPGEYAEFDRFLGIKNGTLRQVAKQFYDLPLSVIKACLQSQFNEERLFALIILVAQYKKGDQITKNTCYQCYLKNMQSVNNWNLVDCSAHLILGVHLWDKDRTLLFTLAQSSSLWERRIAIVATWYFIKQRDFSDTIDITKMLMHDKEDLIHKACGWMLREVGKQEITALTHFLDQYCLDMPRTMLRYAIEKFPEKTRQHYLQLS